MQSCLGFFPHSEAPGISPRPKPGFGRKLLRFRIPAVRSARSDRFLGNIRLVCHASRGSSASFLHQRGATDETAKFPSRNGYGVRTISLLCCASRLLSLVITASRNTPTLP